MSYIIGIDAGGTKTKAIAYSTNGEVLCQKITGHGNLSVNFEEGIHHIDESIELIQKELNNEKLKKLTIGIAGLPFNQKKEVEEYFTHKYSTPTEILTDYELAYKASFGNGDGVLAIAGTGSLLYGKHNGQEQKLSGWGHLLGDDVSGYGIVIHALKKVISNYEATGKISSLMTIVPGYEENQSIEVIKSFIYKNQKSEIAAVAPKVLELVEAGNEDALQVVNMLADRLVDYIGTMIKRLECDSSLKIVLMGGLMDEQSYIYQRVVQKLIQMDSIESISKVSEPCEAVLYSDAKKRKPQTYDNYNNNGRLGIGLMSGTSLDGIDVALCRISGVEETTQVELVDFLTTNYSSEIHKKLVKMLTEEKVTLEDVCTINFELSDEYVRAVKEICNKNDVSLSTIDLIASHGQTLYHETQGQKRLSTLQLGNPAVIAYETGIKVVSDFRSKDVAAHGQGAPLVPKTEQLLYQDESPKVLLNIGGIANLTYLPKGSSNQPVVGFDTGPGNMMINEAMEHYYGRAYDKNGEKARSGKIVDALLDELMSHDYVKGRPPKSTGREQFGVAYTQRLLEKYDSYEANDIIRTLTEFTAKSIAESVIDLAKTVEIESMIAGGGGAYNNMLMDRIKYYLNDQTIDVYTQEEMGQSSDAKEAIAFVILANQTLENKYGNIPEVTGAKEEVVLGSITYPN